MINSLSEREIMVLLLFLHVDDLINHYIGDEELTEIEENLLQNCEDICSEDSEAIIIADTENDDLYDCLFNKLFSEIVFAGNGIEQRDVLGEMLLLRDKRLVFFQTDVDEKKIRRNKSDYLSGINFYNVSVNQLAQNYYDDLMKYNEMMKKNTGQETIKNISSSFGPVGAIIGEINQKSLKGTITSILDGLRKN